MATKKDLVEAYSFSRRRLVTAFVSGAPGGREVEPTKPGRTIVGGLALAILLLAGAAIAGVLKPNVDVDWEQPGFVLSKEKGAAYVILEPDEEGNARVRPVINVTSAQLILGEDIEPEVVPQEEIDTQTPGADIGILGAPVTVPDTDHLVESGWTACTGDGLGIKLDVRTRPDATPVASGGVVVRAGKAVHVIAESVPEDGDEPTARRFELPRTPGMDILLGALGLEKSGSAAKVPTDWLDLFPRGGALAAESLGLDGFGTPSAAAGKGGLPADAKVGDYYEIDSVLYVLTKEGPAQFTAFPSAVFLNLDFPQPPRDLGLEEPPDLLLEDPPYAAAGWPDELPTVASAECAQLLPLEGEKPRVLLADGPGSDASAEDVERKNREVTVEAGQGAYVLSGGWDSADVGEPFVVDSKGFSYALLGTDAVENLGYAGYDAPVVPESWMELFGSGVALSVNAALCPPSRPDAPAQEAAAPVESAEEGRSCE
ncbi:type VII secretion protein EccB [Nocardioides sp. cx-169]|uniref:type VII secretion protein EccB n=1 Tax=Nocardioides sp. cx-169 TaxID=2899080 RepID=UPI001E43B865|nr:type VII secretion protein EccB [Nocardioides sp. cx-169]MCD4532771.1 type VII secretion protein EccB [Nocardioides sp. cx-169]